MPTPLFAPLFLKKIHYLLRWSLDLPLTYNNVMLLTSSHTWSRCARLAWMDRVATKAYGLQKFRAVGRSDAKSKSRLASSVLRLFAGRHPFPGVSWNIYWWTVFSWSMISRYPCAACSTGIVRGNTRKYLLTLPVCWERTKWPRPPMICDWMWVYDHHMRSASAAASKRIAIFSTIISMNESDRRPRRYTAPRYNVCDVWTELLLSNESRFDHVGGNAQGITRLGRRSLRSKIRPPLSP